MDAAKCGVVAGFVLMLAGLWGCQAETSETPQDRALRVYARAHGVQVGAGKVDPEKLTDAMLAKGEREADLAVAELGNQMAGDAVGEALVKLIATGRKQLDMAAENIANEKTSGYRRVNVDRPGKEAGRDMSQGALVRTDRQLDLAIVGEGFFMVKNQRTGQREMTRSGNWFVNSDGQLTSVYGDRLLDPPITVPSDSTGITVSSDGRVFSQSTSPASTEIGQMQLARFRNVDGLATKDGVHFTETDAAGPAMIGNPGTNGSGMLQQGCLEDSNVDLLIEMLRVARLVRWMERLEAAVRTVE